MDQTWALLHAQHPSHDDATIRSSPLPPPPSFRPSRRPPSRLGATAVRVAKRKPRPTKRTSTTFIAADPANFRQLVQHVTGAPVDAPAVKLEDQGGAAHHHRHREPSSRCQLAVPLPPATSFLLEHYHLQQQQQLHDTVIVDQPTVRGPAHESFPTSIKTFPTLESWAVMRDFTILEY